MSKDTTGRYHEPPKVKHMPPCKGNGERAGKGRTDPDGISRDKPDSNDGFSGKLPRK
jgi:hypothetical protein